MRIAINGFGRIGRAFLRTVFADTHTRKKLEIVLINIGPAEAKLVAHMFKYDSVMGTFKGSVAYADNVLVIEGHKIPLVAITEATKYNWKSYDIDWVVDASGRYATQELSKVHIVAGAKHVLVTAPCKGQVTTIVPGVNDDQFDAKRDKVVSLASCTTNALMPMLKVLHDAYDIEQGFMTTVHAYTNSQVLIDVESDDPRRARAAAINIIPTSTGVSDMIDKIIPDLKGKILSTSIRVPVVDVSLIELTIKTKKQLTVVMVNELYKQAATGSLKGILAVTDEPLVSSDYIGNSSSVVIDMLLTQASGSMAKLAGWYDNEWGYSTRLKDFLLKVVG